MAASKSSRSSSLTATLQTFLAARGLSTAKLAVGLSGGRDSVVLLHALAGLGLREQLLAIHVHHGLSPRADDWADFCANFCGRLEVPLRVMRVSVSRNSGSGLEAAARAVRYAAFRQCDVRCLLLAHHQGDQAETLLFNLVRGTGIAGAAGVPVEREQGGLRVLRPLLDVPRATIEAYAEVWNLTWVDDESNADTGLSRNFLRHEVLPVIEGRFPGTVERLAQAAANFAEADSLLAEMAAADWLNVAVGEACPLPSLRRLNSARVKNLLRYRLRELGWGMPVANRLEEFARQLLEAATGRRPQLRLPEGEMRVVRGILRWFPHGRGLRLESENCP